MSRSGGRVGVVGSSEHGAGLPDLHEPVGRWRGSSARRRFIRGDARGDLEALPERRATSVGMGESEGHQRRLNLEALNDAKGVAPIVDLLAGNVDMLRFR